MAQCECPRRPFDEKHPCEAAVGVCAPGATQTPQIYHHLLTEPFNGVMECITGGVASNAGELSSVVLAYDLCGGFWVWFKTSWQSFLQILPSKPNILVSFLLELLAKQVKPIKPHYFQARVDFKNFPCSAEYKRRDFEEGWYQTTLTSTTWTQNHKDIS